MTLTQAVAIEGGLCRAAPLDNRWLNELLSELTDDFFPTVEEITARAAVVRLTNSLGLTCRVVGLPNGQHAILLPVGLAVRAYALASLLFRPDLATGVMAAPLTSVFALAEGSRFWPDIQAHLTQPIPSESTLRPARWVAIVGSLFLVLREVAAVTGRHTEILRRYDELARHGLLTLPLDHLREGCRLVTRAHALRDLAHSMVCREHAPQTATPALSGNFRAIGFAAAVSASLALGDPAQAEPHLTASQEAGSAAAEVYLRESFGAPLADAWHTAQAAGWTDAAERFRTLAWRSHEPMLQHWIEQLAVTPTHSASRHRYDLYTQAEAALRLAWDYLGPPSGLGDEGLSPL